MVCLICKLEFNSYRSLGVHIKRTHHIETKDYYDKFLKKDKEDICPACGQKKDFNNLHFGYSFSQFCSIKCAQNNEEVRQRLEKTCLERYGLTNGGGSKDSVDKIKRTKKEKYGEENYCNAQKIKKTFRKKYGVDNFFQSNSFKEIMTEEKQKKRLEKQRKTFEQLGKWIPIEQKSDFEKYSREVWIETRKWSSKLFENWDGKDFYTGERLITNEEYKKNFPDKHINTNGLQPSIDHKIEIIKGFFQKISPEEIGHLSNLCICSKKTNTKKRWGII